MWWSNSYPHLLGVTHYVVPTLASQSHYDMAYIVATQAIEPTMGISLVPRVSRVTWLRVISRVNGQLGHSIYLQMWASGCAVVHRGHKGSSDW